uniref:Uncharacterized protein n=1 Tax=Eubacterium cellulosolvens (strain ATCC 43171 / JCM 9499 / 6) TaxID=633697 RepID=I5AU22_EUBC6
MQVVFVTNAASWQLFSVLTGKCLAFPVRRNAPLRCAARRREDRLCDSVTRKSQKIKRFFVKNEKAIDSIF